MKAIPRFCQSSFINLLNFEQITSGFDLIIFPRAVGLKCMTGLGCESLISQYRNGTAVEPAEKHLHPLCCRDGCIEGEQTQRGRTKPSLRQDEGTDKEKNRPMAEGRHMLASCWSRQPDRACVGGNRHSQTSM